MKEKDQSYIEHAVGYLRRILSDNQVAFFSTIIIGLITHMFMFSNKLVNHDDIHELFGKGATISSGRWGLVLLEAIFPNYSMPWIYGAISLVLIAVAVCLIVKLFSIQNKILQVLLAGLIVSFPAQVGTFCYMFTSAPYALSLLLAVTAVAVFENGTWKSRLIASVLGILSLSIYQAYIAIIASFFVLLLINELLSGAKTTAEVIKHGCSQVLFLAVIMVIYYASVQLSLLMAGTSFNEYANENFTVGSVNLVKKVYVAYVNFMYFFTRRNWGLLNTPASVIMHLVAAFVVTVVVISSIRGKRWGAILLLVVLTALLPLAINCMYLIMEEEAIHTLVLYAFIAVYILAAFIIEDLMQKKFLAKDVVLVALLFILVNNIFIANKTYLQMHIAYENAHSLYTSVITQVKQTPEFDENKKLAIVGNCDKLVYKAAEFGENKIQGVGKSLVNVYSRETFIRYYLGFDIPFATENEIESLLKNQDFIDMQEYPYYGSVKSIDDYIVVKFGSEDTK